MRSIELGIVLPMEEAWTDGSTPRWVEIRELALRAEALGFDTVWIPDELLWRRADGSIHGWWESVAMTGAVAAATSRVKVGTWILSALHRNPAITAKAVETLDEISGGRFVSVPPTAGAGWTSLAFARLQPDSRLATITSMARNPRRAPCDRDDEPRRHRRHGHQPRLALGGRGHPDAPRPGHLRPVVLRAGTTASGPVIVTVGAKPGDCQPSDDASCYDTVGPVQSWTSSDGTTWTSHPVAGIDLQPCDGCNVSPPRVAIGAGGVVVYQPVDGGTQLALSADGATWELPPAAFPAKAAIGDLQPFGTGFLAVGADPDGERAVAFASPDGRTWTRHVLPVPDLGSLGAGGSRILIAQNGVLAEGSVQATPGRGLWWTSEDGSAWKRDAAYAPIGVWNGEGDGSGLSTPLDRRRRRPARGPAPRRGRHRLDLHERRRVAGLDVTGLGGTPKGSWPDLDLTLLPVGVLYRADDGVVWLGTPSDL